MTASPCPSSANVSDPIRNSRTRRAEPRPECWVPCPLVWFVDCHSARVPISFASQSRVSGAVWRCATTPEKLSVRLGSRPGCPDSASGSATDWVTTMTCPPWLRPRCRIATARFAAILITAPNSSSISVHGAPACAGGVVEVGEREHGHRGGLVGHHVGVHPPHHDGSRPERVDESDADRLAVGSEPRGDDLAVGERERHLEPGRTA